MACERNVSMHEMINIHITYLAAQVATIITKNMYLCKAQKAAT
jgi:hypothetical protein